MLMRGPYGTNEGDIWLAPDSPVQERLDADGEGYILVHEVMLDVETGSVDERVYVTKNPAIIEEATRGHEKYVAQMASQN